MVHPRKYIVIFSRTPSYVYNMHQDTKSARLIALCKRTLTLFKFYSSQKLYSSQKSEEPGGNPILVRNIISQQIALNRNITQHNFENYLNEISPYLYARSMHLYGKSVCRDVFRPFRQSGIPRFAEPGNPAKAGGKIFMM